MVMPCNAQAFKARAIERKHTTLIFSRDRSAESMLHILHKEDGNVAAEDGIKALSRSY